MKNTVATFKKMKNEGTKISMLTAYDYSTAKLVDEAGINSILVGDSLGMVMLGYEDTLSATLQAPPPPHPPVQQAATPPVPTPELLRAFPLPSRSP